MMKAPLFPSLLFESQIGQEAQLPQRNSASAMPTHACLLRLSVQHGTLSWSGLRSSSRHLLDIPRTRTKFGERSGLASCMERTAR